MEFTMSCETYINDLECKLIAINDAIADSGIRSFNLLKKFEEANSNFVKLKLKHLFEEEVKVEESLKEEKRRIIDKLEDAKKDQLLYEEFG